MPHIERLDPTDDQELNPGEAFEVDLWAEALNNAGHNYNSDWADRGLIEQEY